MSYRLIALDLDGTLLNSQKEITPRAREALRAARERGIVTAVATGRAPTSAAHWSRQMGGGPAIAANGAALLNEQGDLVTTRPLPRAPLLRMLEVGKEADLLLECYTPSSIILDRPVSQMKAYLRWVRPSMSLWASLGGLLSIWRINRIRSVRNLARWAAQPGAPPVLKLMAVGAPAELGALAERIRTDAPGLSVTSSAPDNLEVMAAGVTKGSALQQLAARLRIPREGVIAVGDSANDLEMLQWAGMGVAMANGTDQVKAVARRTTASCDDDGVARLIEELCLS